MPHWTLPRPGNDTDPTAPTVKALISLQSELDKVFDHATGITASELDNLAAHVATFNADFESHLKTARANLASG